jgi:hypothetical protein
VEIELVYGTDFERSYTESLAAHLQGQNRRLKVETIGHSDPEYREFVRVYMYRSFLLMPYLRQAIDNGDLEATVLRELAIHDKYSSSPAEPITQKEAFQASIGRVVLYYGHGIAGLDSVVTELRQAGIDAITAAGAADGRLQIIAQRRFLTGYDCCSQSQIADGTAVLLARRLFTAKTKHDLKRLLKYIDSGITLLEAEIARLDREYSAMQQRLAEIERMQRAIAECLSAAVDHENIRETLLREYEERTGLAIDRKSKAKVNEALLAYMQMLTKERQALSMETE